MNKKINTPNASEKKLAEYKRARFKRPDKNRSNKFFNAVIVILILAIAALIIISAINASSNRKSGTENGNTYANDTITICIDPGHGFGDTGAQSALLGGLDEKDINLSISKYTAEALSDKGYNVIMTRTDDIMPDGYDKDNQYTMTPQERAALANSYPELNLFVSIHCNSYPQSSEIRGTRIYYYANHSEKISLFANSVCDGISSVLPDISVKQYPMSSGEAYYVIKNISAPSLLIETGFITNPEDAAFMINDEWQKSFAQGIASGIASYCESMIAA